MTLKNQKPFSFLNNLINILIVDDDINILTLLNDVIKTIPIYSIHNARTAEQADKILSSPKRIHLCLLDLGISDIKDDEFYLLRKYGKKVFFIIFTGRQSPFKGFSAHTLGARALIEKTTEFNEIDFIKTINYNALLNIINPKYYGKKDSLSLSTEILFKKSPLFVSKWAKLMGVTDRTLRHIWKNNLGANAKIILSTYCIFNSAFNYYEKLIQNNNFSEQPLIQTDKYNHLEEFFYMHRNTISDFINYGNITISIK